jgi:hypothetical protein
LFQKSKRKEKGERPSVNPHHHKPDHDTYYDMEEYGFKG